MDEQAISDAVRAVSRVDDVFADPAGPEVFPWIGVPKYSNVAFHLSTMASLGTGDPSTSEWTLSLAIRHHGEFIGVIDLRRRWISRSTYPEVEAFPVLLRDLGFKIGDGYVETGSYILRPFQGHGFGTQARRAALTVAFAYCDCDIAVSESWPMNAASQAVSLSCGYTFLGSNDGGSSGVGNEKVRMYCTPEMFDCGSTSVHVDGWTPELSSMLGIQPREG
ncbi:MULTISPECIES: GNAT family N-acetyltransferase [Corynebacterium]|nr:MULTISPECIES: GNAT family N-acetyltransferase [Corynebacterium]QRQ64435.1 GNAT family N-acetyltransferase [Corynebacterium kroppenstedtii]